jgi:hypothetical protein
MNLFCFNMQNFKNVLKTNKMKWLWEIGLKNALMLKKKKKCFTANLNILICC